MIQDKNMNKNRSKTLVRSAIYLLISTVIAVQELEMKEEKQYSVVNEALPPYLLILTLQPLEIGAAVLTQTTLYTACSPRTQN
jgi:hypothetical protein